MTTATLAPPRRSARGRAALAVLLLLGFYVLGLGIIGLLVALNLWSISEDNVSPRLIGITAVVGFALLRGMFFVERRSAADDVTGYEVTDADEPRLWALVREVAAQLQTDPPAHLYLVPDVNAFVFQRSKFLGLVPGPRVMGIGVPLLEVLSPDELRGVLAHEFGHYTGGDTRLGPVVYRGRASIGRTIGHLGEGSVVGAIIRAYGKLYMRVSQAVSRRQELDADANAAHLVGPATHASALRRVHVAAPVFEEFMERYVGPMWDGGARPRALYEGYRQFHDHPDHADSITAAVTKLEAAAGDPYDSHPSLGARVAALGATDTEHTPADERAVSLLADPAAADARMTELISRLVTENPALPVVDWGDEAAAAICEPDAKAESERLRDAVARITGREPRVADALTILEEQGVMALARAVDIRVANVEEAHRERVARGVVARAIAGTVSAALTTQNGWRWALSWSGPASLVSPKGRTWDHWADVAAAVEDPAKVPALRKKLRTRGIPA